MRICRPRRFFEGGIVNVFAHIRNRIFDILSSNRLKNENCENCDRTSVTVIDKIQAFEWFWPSLFSLHYCILLQLESELCSLLPLDVRAYSLPVDICPIKESLTVADPINLATPGHKDWAILLLRQNNDTTFDFSTKRTTTNTIIVIMPADPKKDKKDDKETTTHLNAQEAKEALELRPQHYHSPPTYHYEKPSGSK